MVICGISPVLFLSFQFCLRFRASILHKASDINWEIIILTHVVVVSNKKGVKEDIKTILTLFYAFNAIYNNDDNHNVLTLCCSLVFVNITILLQSDCQTISQNNKVVSWLNGPKNVFSYHWIINIYIHCRRLKCREWIYFYCYSLPCAAMYLFSLIKP